MSLTHEPFSDTTPKAEKQLEVIGIILENTSTDKKAQIIIIGGAAISAQNIKSLLKNGEFTTAEGVSVKASAIADNVDLDAVVSFNKEIPPFVENIGIAVLSKENQIEQGESGFILGRQNRVGIIQNEDILPEYNNAKKKFLAKVGRVIHSDNTLSYTLLPGMKVQLDVEFGDF